MKESVFVVGFLTLFRTFEQIESGLMSAHNALVYGIAGAALIFCGLYIHGLEKTNKELLELNKELLKNNRKSLEISQEMLDYLNGLDDDTDPDGGEKMAM